MRKETGFTLIELMVGITIVSVLVGIAIPVWSNWLPSYRLKAATRNVVSIFQKAKVEAVQRNVSVALAFDPATGTYTMFVDDGDGAGGIADNFTQDGTELLLGSYEVPSLVTITDPTSFTGNATSFNSRGLPGRLGRVILTNTKGITRDIVLSIVGNIRIE